MHRHIEVKKHYQSQRLFFCHASRGFDKSEYDNDTECTVIMQQIRATYRT